MTYYVSSGTLNPSHLPGTHSLSIYSDENIWASSSYQFAHQIATCGIFTAPWQS